MKMFYRSLFVFLLSFFLTKSYAKFGSLTLGNQVWNDYDGDGKRDPDEPGIGNVTVMLYAETNGDNLPDQLIAVLQTDINGRYSFTGLFPGRYIVSIPLLPGYTQSPNTIAHNLTSPYPDNDVDNDDNIVNNVGGVLYTNAITLSANGEPHNRR